MVLRLLLKISFINSKKTTSGKQMRKNASDKVSFNLEKKIFELQKGGKIYFCNLKTNKLQEMHKDPLKRLNAGPSMQSIHVLNTSICQSTNNQASLNLPSQVSTIYLWLISSSPLHQLHHHFLLLLILLHLQECLSNKPPHQSQEKMPTSSSNSYQIQMAHSQG